MCPITNGLKGEEEVQVILCCSSVMSLITFFYERKQRLSKIIIIIIIVILFPAAINCSFAAEKIQFQIDCNVYFRFGLKNMQYHIVCTAFSQYGNANQMPSILSKTNQKNSHLLSQYKIRIEYVIIKYYYYLHTKHQTTPKFAPKTLYAEQKLKMKK